MDEQAGKKVFRFAPSPNGYLHLGHACSALLNFELARREGGRFLLRIEDIDPIRSRPEFEQAIYEDLSWLGVSWEKPVRRQSEHFSDYESALAKLGSLGVLYPCDCSRADIARAAPNGPRDFDGAPIYPGTCRGRPLGETARGKVGLRLNMAKAAARVGRAVSWRERGPRGDRARDIVATPAEWGDVILARKDVPASYHVAVVVDDALQGVTDVVRGADLYRATSIHRLLQILMGLPAPTYLHHELVLDEAGGKLSKSLRSRSLRALRAEGASPADVRRILGFA